MDDDITEENIRNFQDIIENYDKIVKDLSLELHQLRHDQEKLKSDFSQVISENRQLSQDLQNAISSKQEAFAFPSETNNEALDNLRTQVKTLQTEKDCVTKLWQNCVKTIDHLEDELKVYQAGTQGFVPKKDVQKLKFFYEEKISSLELELASTQKKLDETVKYTTSQIETKHTEIDQSLENQVSALKIIKNLESEVLKLQKRLQETVHDKIRLEKVLEHKEDLVQGLKSKNHECLAKVTEAVSVVEAALNEKDAALLRESEIKAENEKLVQTMTEIVKESEEKIKREILAVKNENVEKQKSLLKELNQAHTDLASKQREIDDWQQRYVLLENEIARMHKATTQPEGGDINKLLILEKNLESTFQKLLLSEKQNIQLSSEKETMKNDLEQMADLYERNLKAKEVEMATLKSKIARLENELRESNEQMDRVTTKIARLNEQIEKTEREFKAEKEIHEMGIRTAYQEKLEEATKNYNSNVKELQMQLEKKNELNQKWRKETKVITENLEKLVINLKQEIQSVKKENKSLKERLRKAEEKINQYRHFLELVSQDVNKLSSLTIGSNTDVR